MQPDPIVIDGPVTVTFTPQQLQVVVSGLAELAYKHAQPVLQHIYAAVRPEPPP